MSDDAGKSGRILALAVALLWLAAAAALGLLAHAPSPALESGRNVYLPTWCPSQAAEIRLAQLFPDYRPATAVIVFHRAAGLTDADRAAIGQLVEWIHRPPKLVDLPSDEAKTVRDALVCAPVASSVADPFLAARLNSPDGTTTLVIVGLPDIFTALRSQATVQALARHLHEMNLAGLQAEITGNGGFYENYAAAANQSVNRASLVAVALVVIILLLIYRSPVAILVPIITIAVAVFFAMHLLYALAPLGFVADPVIEMFVVVVVFGAGTDYCLFLISRYKEEVGSSSPLSAAMSLTLRRTAWPIIAAALTVICGLSLMALADFLAFKKAGPSVAVALAVGALASLTLAPALYLLAGRAIFWPRRLFHPSPLGEGAALAAGEGLRPETASPAYIPPMSGLWSRLSHLVIRHPLLVAAATVALLAVPAVFGLRAKPTHNIFDELSPRWSSVKGFEILRYEYPPGLMGPLTVLVESRTSLESKEGFAALGRVAATLRENPLVAEVVTPVQPLGSQQKPLASLDQVPKGPLREKLEDYFFAADGRAARFEVLLNRGPYEDDAVAAASQIRAALARAAQSDPALSAVALAGASPTLADLEDVTDRDYVRVFLAVLIAVYLILAALLRRPILAALLVGGTALSFLTALGIADLVFVRFLGAPGLDWKVKIFLFVLLVAVGVDYTIYLCSRIRQESLSGRSPEDSVRAAMVRTGGIISAAGLIVAGTFGSMMAGTLALTIQLGLALAVGILIDTFLVRPLFVPAAALLLSRLSRRWFKRFEL
jgi:RND superfamily putative drug exporter